MNLSNIQNHDELKLERNVGQSLTMAMEMFNTDAKAMAESLGMSRAYLYKIKEQKTVNASRLKDISAYYNLTSEQFLDLPLKPLVTAYISTSSQIFNYIKEHKPKLGRYTVQAEKLSDEVAQIISMLEKS